MQQHREHLVDAAEPARVDLADGDRLGLEELLEHDPVVDVLAGRDADRARRRGRSSRGPGCRRGSWAPRSSTGRTRRGGAIQSIASSTSQRWLASTASIASGPISSRTIRARRRSSSTSAPTFILKRVQPSASASRQSRRILSSVVAEPADRGRVGRVAVATQLRLALGARRSQRRAGGRALAPASARRRCSGSR